MKNFRLAFTALACLILVSSIAFVGCGNKSSGKLKISSWGDLQENQILVDLINDFQKIHPEIQVELQRIPYNEYVTKLLTQMAGNVAPDVIFTEVENFADLFLRNALEPLNPFIQNDKLDMSVYYPQVVDRFTVDKQLYVIPRDTAPICVIYYNKKAFDEAGVPYPTDDWTYEQFVATAKKVMKKDKSGKVTRWGFVDDWVMPEPWIYDFGGSYANDVKHPTQWTFASDPNTLAGIQFRADLIYKYKIMMPPSMQAEMGGMGTSDMFINGSTAMFLSGLWKTPSFREIKNFQWDVVMFPKGPNGNRAFGTGGSGYGILKNSTHKQEAWELVKYISGEEGAKKLAATGLAQPALMAAANSPLFLDNQDPHNKKMVLDAVKYVKYSPMCKNWFETKNSIIGPELDRVWNGSETPEEAMQKLKSQLDKNPPEAN
jgi:ABC-type glycerol-3-phosphate transport system substrate-binding protein